MNLAYGVCIGPSGSFERVVEPSIYSIDANSTIIVRRDQTSIFAAYNSIIDEALEKNVDVLVLIHDDVAIRDSEIANKLGSFIADPTVAIVGVAGASNLKSIRWSRYDARGAWTQQEHLIELRRGTFDVDMVDGLFMALFYTAMTKLRFDEHRFSGFHGYDADFGMQARAAGLRVVVTEIDIYHDGPISRVHDEPSFVRANRTWRMKWGIKDELSRRERLMRVAGPLAPLVNRHVDGIARVVHRNS